MRRAAKRAFTLVELLVVIAISTILLGLLLYPLFYAQQITNRVQSQATAQDAARNGVERISRELSQATFVFDNTTTAVVIPLNRTINFDGGPTNRPRILFAKLDYILPDSQGTPGGTIDPTTGKPLTGNHITFPLAPGTRVVRNFLGLADNAKLYGNRYEFRGEDTDFNPVLLYRAEFKMDDPDLIVPTPLGEDSTLAGRFNDPNFFYNTNVAPNGRPFAENWKRKVSAVISGPRLDMLAWRRDSSRELITDLPFQTLAYFAPSAVPGDTATPGSLTAGNAETPGAPPTLYSAQHGQWTLPFTVTFFRSTTRNSGTNEGSAQFVVEMDNTVNPARPRVRLASSSGKLATLQNEVFTSLSAVSGKIFVKTPRLTFSVDALRGRVETGFPPLAGTTGGVPLFAPASGGAVIPMNPSVYPDANFGELVPTVLRINTLDSRAGALGVRPDQGLWGIDLLAATGGTERYYADTLTPIAGLGAGFPSPLRVFGNTDGTGAVLDAGGVMIAPGTEQVLGPEMPMSATAQLLPYNRINETVGTTLLAKSFAGLAGNAALPYAPVNGQRNYVLSQFFQPNRALIWFDAGEKIDIGNGLLGAGTPALPDPNTPGLPASLAQPRELRVSYLWQNNFARDTQGYPLNAADQRAATGDFKPEGDVVKLDYSTRSLLNVQIGARVHDSNAPVPQTIQFSDKVRVGNAVR